MQETIQQPEGGAAVRSSDLLAALDAKHLEAESNMDMDLRRKDYAKVYGWQCHIRALLITRRLICEQILKAANVRGQPCRTKSR
jgi:hypothetical protein